MILCYTIGLFAGLLSMALVSFGDWRRTDRNDSRTQLGDVVLSAKAGDECDMRKDVLLVEDASSEQAYLQCRPAGRGVVGFWQWMPCAKGERFYFSEQRCLAAAPGSTARSTPNPSVVHESVLSSSDTTVGGDQTTVAPETTSSEQAALGAFVNQSCANGDHCLGGSVCDPSLLLCKCPPGTAISDQAGTTCRPEPTTAAPATTTRTVAPGSSCRGSGEHCGGGSFCDGDNAVCTCPEGQADKNGTCTIVRIEPVPAGGKCDSFSYCSGGASCSRGTCVCQSPLVRMGDQCGLLTASNPPMKTAGPGQPCDQGQTCGGGSLCSTVTLLCACPVGTREDGEECVPVADSPASLASVGQKCNVNSDCVVGAFCSAGIDPPACHCLSTHVPVGDACYRIVSPGQRGCDYSEQCSAAFQGATCENGVCACPPGMTERAHTCQPAAPVRSPTAVGPGQSCTANATCSGGAMCAGGMCTCPRGRTQSGDSCVRKGETRPTTSSPFTTPKPAKGTATSLFVPPSSPGGSCAAGRHCAGGSVCRDGWCVCPDSDMIVHNGTCAFGSIKPTVPIRLATSAAPSLAGNHLFGQLGSREHPGYYLQPGVPSPVFPAPVQTLNNAHFLIPGSPGIYVPHVPGRGHPAVFAPERASAPFIPAPNSGADHGGSYPLLPGLLPAGIRQAGAPSHRSVHSDTAKDRPLQIPVPAALVLAKERSVSAGPGSPCGDRIQCTGASTCQNGQCVCQEGQEIVNELCVTARRTSRVNNSTAWPSAVPLEACANGELCGGGSICDGQLCQCPSGTEARQGLCQAVPPKLSSPNGPCSDGHRCLGGSVCNTSSGLCQCPVSTIAVGPRCLPIGRLVTLAPNHDRQRNLLESPPLVRLPSFSPPSGPCDNGRVCVGGSVCHEGTCQCPTGTTPNARGVCDNSSAVAAVGDLCAQGDVCAGYSTCINERCRCPPGTMQTGPTCVPLAGHAQLGAPCAADAFCQGNGTCKNRICACKDGYVEQNGSCQLVASRPGQRSAGLQLYSAPGDPCVTIDDCTGGSYCRLGFCVCPLGTESINLQCLVSRTLGSAAVGQSCASGQRCSGLAMCVHGVCQSMAIGNTIGYDSRSSSSGQQRIGSFPYSRIPAQPLSFNSVTLSTGRNAVPSSGGLLADRIPLPALQPTHRPPLASVEGGNGAVLPLSSAPSVNSEAFVHYLNGYQNGNPIHSLWASPNSTGRNPFPVPSPVAFGPTGSLQHRSEKKVTRGPSSAGPGQPCEHGERCWGGSVCSMGTCACPAGLRVSREGDQCEPDGLFVPPGSFCGTGQTCTGGSYCVTGVCLCPPGRHIQGVECGRGALPAARRARPQSRASYVSALSKLVARPNEYCGRGVQCLGGSTCYHDMRCRCLPPLAMRNGTCRRAGQSNRSPVTPGPAECPLPGNATACALPNCSCSKTGKEPPGNLRLDATPQFVVLTFDDAVNNKTLDPFANIFHGRYWNKNGCPLRGTFFVSHEGTDYSDVQNLYSQGHEVASNSITHRDLTGERVDRWMAEMNGQRRIMANLANIDKSDIVGFRAPQLALAGDTAFEMMQQGNFLYDNSMSVNPGLNQAPYWPQTLDYRTPWECQGAQCPRRPFPGRWVVPLNQFFNGPPSAAFYEEPIRGAMVRAVLTERDTEDSVYQMLRRNFYRAYNTNKAPYVLTLDGALADRSPDSAAVPALRRFLDEAAEKPDVWFVTIRQLLDWMQSPVPVQQLASYAPFSCADQGRRMCQRPKRCLYRTRRLTKKVHSFKTCAPCPKNYPWLDNADGR